MVPKDELLRKLAPTSLSRGRPQCWCLQCLPAFNRVGVLLAFHVLNVLVAIGGVLSAALLLVDMALMLWVHPFLAAAIVLNRKCEPLVYIVYSGNESFSENFVTNNDHDPDECTYRFELPAPTDDNSDIDFLPHMLMTRHMWLAVVYFAVFKLVIGMLSTAVLGVTVVLPLLVIFSGDDISVFGGQVTFNDNPIMYTVMTVWLVGVIGVPVVAVLSTKATLWVCDIEQRQTEVNVESAIPATPNN